MASIEIKKRGAAPVVLLNSYDRELLTSAFSWFCSEKNLSVEAVAKLIGVSRQQIYVILTAKEIELQRLIKIQDVLDIWLLDSQSINEYLLRLQKDLTRPQSTEEGSLPFHANDWFYKCNLVRVNAFYSYVYLRRISNLIWHDDRNNTKDFFEQFRPEVRDNELVVEVYELLKKGKQELISRYNKNRIGIDVFIADKISSFIELTTQSISFNLKDIKDLDLTENNKEIDDSKYSIYRKDRYGRIHQKNDYFILVPVAGGEEFWKSYDKETRDKINNSIDIFDKNTVESHLKIHNEFIETVYQFAKDYDSNLTLLNTISFEKKRRLRHWPIWPKEIKELIDNFEKMSIPFDDSEAVLFNRLVEFFEQRNVKSIEKEKVYKLDLKPFCFDILVTTKNKKTIGIEIKKTRASSLGINIIPVIENLGKIKNDLQLDYVVIIANVPFETAPKIIADKLGVILTSENDIETSLDFV